MSTLTSLVQPDTSTAVALLQLQQQRAQNLMSPIYSTNYRPITDGQAASPVSLSSTNVAESSSGQFAYSRSLPGQQFAGQPQQMYQPLGVKRKMGDFEVTIDSSLDVIGRGLVTFDEAIVFFRCFFQGCVRLPFHFKMRFLT